MPSAAQTAAKFIADTHVMWYRASGGLLGGNVWGAPILLLTATGRKSAQPRITPLLYLRDADDYVVIASNGGSPRHPLWWRNLQADPRAQVQVWGEQFSAVATRAEGSERERIWRAIAARYPIYSWYERQTSREIPVVVLRRQDAPAANGRPS